MRVETQFSGFDSVFFAVLSKVACMKIARKPRFLGIFLPKKPFFQRLGNNHNIGKGT